MNYVYRFIQMNNNFGFVIVTYTVSYPLALAILEARNLKTAGQVLVVSEIGAQSSSMRLELVRLATISSSSNPDFNYNQSKIEESKVACMLRRTYN